MLRNTLRNGISVSVRRHVAPGVLPWQPRRSIFDKIFKRQVGGCDKLDDVFQVFRDKIQEELPKIEETVKAKDASTEFLLNTLINCQKVEVMDKFFYDEVMQTIEANLLRIISSKDLVRLGVGLGMNNKITQDHAGLIKKFYGHCFLNRHLLTLNDRHTLSQIFQALEAAKISGGHLDMFKDVRRGEAMKLAQQTLFDGIKPPEHISLNFDFENKVVLLLNKTSKQTIVLCSTQSADNITVVQDIERIIRFGQQLIDQFKPYTIFIQESPLQILQQEAKFDEGSGMTLPPISDSIKNLKGTDLEYFINESILGDAETYQFDQKQGLVSKLMRDGQGMQPSDTASLAVHHLNRLSKTVDKEHAQIIFVDLVPEQMTTTFIHSFGMDDRGIARREHLDKELRYSVLLDTTGWLANNLRFGCPKCAPFLTRQKLPMYPLRPHKLMTGRDQVPQRTLAEKYTAYSIIHSTMQNYNEQNFVAFVKEHQLFGVAKEMVKFLSDSESFLNYQQPLPYIEGIRKDDTITRDEVLRRHALQSMLNDEDDMVMPPFPHDQNDLARLKQFEMEYQRDISLSTWFDDIDKIGVEFKDGEDLVAQKPQSLQQAIESQPLLETYFSQKEHGSKLMKCYPLSYVQGNFTYYNVSKLEMESEASGDAYSTNDKEESEQ